MVISIIEATPKSEEDSVSLTKVVKICSSVIKAEEISDITNINILNYKMVEHLENKPKKTLKEMIPPESLIKEFITDYDKYDEMKWFTNVTRAKKHRICLELIKTCTPIRDIDNRSKYKANDTKRCLNILKLIQYLQNLVPKMAWVFDNTDTSHSAKKSDLKLDRAKLGLLNSALYATYSSKLKDTNNKHTHYHLVGEGQFYKNSKDMYYKYSKLSLNELEIAPSCDIQLRQDMFDIYLAVPKNNTNKTIVAASSYISQFYRELAEARVEKKLRRIQNINTTKIPTMQDLADVIMMLSMRPAEYKSDYSWYCIEYIKNKEVKNNSKSQQFLSIKKNPKYAKELLTWIQDAIATRKLHNSVYSINKKYSAGVFSKFLKSYDIIAKRLRKIRGKHASRVHNNQNPTSQHLEFLSRVVMRYKMDHYNSEMYYVKSDTSNSNFDADPEPEPEALVPIFKSINKNTSDIEDIYDLYRSI
ncbi:1010_t:CDS:2 [Cetraspora pellucida]|uniref:1010_t:CDS:1 n=1 Tax=Cetraspora pellucida TaxID=1433469 RepID=A0A9N9D878_9GLOM|nr:1010_t:CDS:2 [Cetraspora pellucida]